jgi:AGZA family xanthine/uracil permease-like MFS transporter
MQAVARYFQLAERGSSVAVELRGAVATFLTMSYILFANPDILGAAGVPKASAVACTAAAAGICCLLMGFGANFPMAVASGMGLNAIIAFQASSLAGSWQAAMGLVVVDGILMLVLVLLGLREAVMAAIPRDLRRAIGAGIGLFIAFIGAANAKLVIKTPDGVALPPVTYGSLQTPEAAVAMAGLLITAVLMVRRVHGAILLGIVASTAIAFVLKVAQLPGKLEAPSFANAFQADLGGALHWKLAPLLLAFMMVDFFDTIGTTTAIADQAGLVDERGHIPGLRAILTVDSLGAVIGGFFGASSVTAYIESAAGIAEGARTGLHTVFVGLLFLAAILLAPVAGMVPAAATAPALLLVGFFMVAEIAKIDYARLETAIPAFITLVTLPVTWSISHGVGYGIISYVVINALTGKARQVSPLMYAIGAAFLAYFIWTPA